jgi:hypothetical protein
MDGKIPLRYWYIDERISVPNPIKNTREIYEKQFEALDNGEFNYYRFEGKSFLDALKKYPLNKKGVMIWGLQGSNCEALAVWAGAAHVYVIEYNKPVCECDTITVYNHKELFAADIKADCAISYSSFEHSGLGRYGDPVSPDGDLEAMNQARDFLKDDGIMYFGVPLGQDCLVWNAHRIYGKYRLPLLLQGWKLLDVFNVYTNNSLNFPFDLPLGESRRQCLLILKKINNKFPDDDYLLKNDHDLGELGGRICNMIQRMIYDYKHSLFENLV